MRDGTPTLGRIVESFFRDTLATQRRASPRTVESYRDALKLFLVFVSKRKGRPPSSLTITDLDAEEVVAFLNHLEADRGCSIATRNVRRTATRHPSTSSGPASRTRCSQPPTARRSEVGAITRCSSSLSERAHASPS